MSETEESIINVEDDEKLRETIKETIKEAYQTHTRHLTDALNSSLQGLRQDQQDIWGHMHHLYSETKVLDHGHAVVNSQIRSLKREMEIANPRERQERLESKIEENWVAHEERITDLEQDIESLRMGLDQEKQERRKTDGLIKGLGVGFSILVAVIGMYGLYWYSKSNRQQSNSETGVCSSPQNIESYVKEKYGL